MKSPTSYAAPLLLLACTLTAAPLTWAQNDDSSTLHVGIRLLRSCAKNTSTNKLRCSAGVPSRVSESSAALPAQIESLTPPSPQQLSGPPTGSARSPQRFTTVTF